MNSSKRVIAISALLGAGLLLAGCSSTTVYPEGNNTYSLVTTSRAQSRAEKGAESKAEKYCKKKGKKLVVLTHKTKYQGIGKEKAAIIGIAGALLTGGAGMGNSNNDYQVSMKFACRGALPPKA